MPANKGALKPYLAWLKNPAWLCFAWFGLTAGISLMEAPVKFTAPAITREAALDVGRVVFAALNRVELVALILVLVTVRVSGHARRLWAPVIVLALIVVTQTAWLLPALSERSQMIVSGVEPGPSPVHAIYGVFEIAKLLLLLFLGFRSLALAGTAGTPR